MIIKEKLEEYDLFDQAIIRHGMLKCIRDYEVIGYLAGIDFASEVQYIFKGCLKVHYIVKVPPEDYSMDDRLLELERQDESDFPDGFVWGVNAARVYPGWTLKENTEELEKLGNKYGIRFYEIYFATDAYDLTIIFHDINITELKRIDKYKNAL